MSIIRLPYQAAKILLIELFAWFKLIIRAWPDSPIGNKLRWHFWRTQANLHGSGRIGRMVDLVEPKLISFGANFICSEYTVINPSDSHGIFIGDNVLIGPNVYIRAANHNFSNRTQPIKAQGHLSAKLSHANKYFSIIIDDDVWIGANTIILSGAKIGKGSIIGAGSVVNKEIPATTIAAGIPARIIKNRGDAKCYEPL